jgi:hypothetical protein
MARFTAFQKKQPGQLRADRAAHIVPMGTFALDAPCWKSALRAAFGHVLLLLLARGVIETLRDPRNKLFSKQMDRRVKPGDDDLNCMTACWRSSQD